MQKKIAIVFLKSSVKMLKFGLRIWVYICDLCEFANQTSRNWVIRLTYFFINDFLQRSALLLWNLSGFFLLIKFLLNEQTNILTWKKITLSFHNQQEMEEMRNIDTYFQKCKDIVLIFTIYVKLSWQWKLRNETKPWSDILQTVH